MGEVNSELKKINSIEIHNDMITAITTFPSGNIISVSKDKSINIYDINFNLIQKIKNTSNKQLSYVYVKDENNFITSSFDGCIKSWIKNNLNQFQLNQIINYSTNCIIYKLIYSSRKIFSCSWDGKIKIYGENNNNLYQLITIIQHFKSIHSILLLEDKNILIASGYNEELKFYDIINYNILISFPKIFCINNDSLERLDNDTIIIGGKDYTIKIISINKKIIIKEIKIEINCWCIFSINHRKIFLIGGLTEQGETSIKIFRNHNYECIQTIKKPHNFLINNFIELKNGLIASYGWDGIINIWSFK